MVKRKYTQRRTTRSGFTLIELTIVVAIIAIVAVMGLPRLMTARLTANEASAISTMRALSTAQALVMAQSSIDSDGDGAGEDGFFGELAGTVGVRTSVAGAPAVGPQPMSPSVLSAAFGNVDANGLVAHSGYYFQIWLPATPVAGLTGGVSELPNTGGADPANIPDPNGSEAIWCCYAWPILAQKSGNRAFFVNQMGEVLQCKNVGAAPYSNVSKMPSFDEAFLTSGDMGSMLRVGIAGGNDSTLWTAVQ